MLNNTPDNFKNVTRVYILDAKKVFYPLRYFLQGRDVRFDILADHVLSVELLPEDIDYPADLKNTDSGYIINYKVAFTINNQSAFTQSKLQGWQGKKVIVVLDYGLGRMIIGSNEMPMRMTYYDENSSSSQKNNTYSVVCTGNTFQPKVIR